MFFIIIGGGFIFLLQTHCNIAAASLFHLYSSEQMLKIYFNIFFKIHFSPSPAPCDFFPP